MSTEYVGIAQNDLTEVSGRFRITLLTHRCFRLSCVTKSDAVGCLDGTYVLLRVVCSQDVLDIMCSMR